MSFAIQNTFPIRPAQGQPGRCARVGQQDYIDSHYVSTIDMQPGWGVILDPSGLEGNVLLPANTVADSHKLIGIVSVDQNTVGTRVTTPNSSNNLEQVIIPAGVTFNVGKQGYFYAMAGQDVVKDTPACFDPVNKNWIKQTDLGHTNMVTATFDENAKAGTIVVIRLSGVVQPVLTV